MVLLLLRNQKSGCETIRIFLYIDSMFCLCYNFL